MGPQPPSPPGRTTIWNSEHSPAGAPALEARLHGALLGVMQVMRRHLEHRATVHGLSMQQAVSLFRLGQADSLSMRELAAELHCDPSNITGIADRLEERGLLARHVQAGDRRVKLLSLTESGEQLRSGLADEVHRDVPGLSALDDADQQELLRLLLKVLAAADVPPLHSPD